MHSPQIHIRDLKAGFYPRDQKPTASLGLLVRSETRSPSLLSYDMATEIVYRRRYQWPEVQLNLWILIILSASATVLGIFAWFITVQNQLQIGTPWYESSQFSFPEVLANSANIGCSLLRSLLPAFHSSSSLPSSFWPASGCSFLAASSSEPSFSSYYGLRLSSRLQYSYTGRVQT